ncbi:hypothetical protein [Bordetella sp. BOR01]|uniref:hypothetical protein n=1 Tax=Bordetella sp. BOR01 TaxID=2854779 RepID=UPI001C4537F7|nr:hypothetical protein [Bordetella sp. BOR01]MBV7487075.1 hypothetical protein [Bordetella sp. BOR01]
MTIESSAAPVAEHPMQSHRLAMLQPSRMSVSRLFMARAIREKWRIRRIRWEIDGHARGQAVYQIDTPTMALSFAIYSFEPTAQGKTGRIIGRSWDMMAALVEGCISEQDLQTTAVELPKLYEGRATPGTLVWARANRSSRVFDHTVASLAEGRQPDIAELAQVCYLMRNTGLDGNGTFGTRSYRTLEADHPLHRPLDAQMLSAYLMRVFSIDLVHHLARERNPQAPEIDPAIQRYLGVGNGSALGLILFVNNHPRLMQQWLAAHQAAVDTACSLAANPRGPDVAQLQHLLERAIAFRQQDRMEYERYADSAMVADELRRLRGRLGEYAQAGTYDGAAPKIAPFAALVAWARQTLHEETVQTFLGLLTELVPDHCDAQAESLSADEEFTTVPDMTVAELRGLVAREYAWTLSLDLDSEVSRRYVWYKSATAEEPRRGPVAEIEYVYNLGLDLPRLARVVLAELEQRPADESTARFLLHHPQYRMIVARIQSLRGLGLHSPHMDIMSEAFVPVDIVRLMNVGLHGIDKARDYLGRNLRGVLFHGAPIPADIEAGADPTWFFPKEPA